LGWSGRSIQLKPSGLIRGAISKCGDDLPCVFTITQGNVVMRHGIEESLSLKPCKADRKAVN
jgi:hypothetical protein